MKKTSKRIISFLVILIIAIVLSACAAKAPGDDSSLEGSNQLYSVSNNESSKTVSSQSSTDRYAEKTEKEVAKELDRKVIRRATLDIMSKEATVFYKKIVDYGVSIGGYEFSYAISNYDTYSVIKADFKVPPEKLVDFISYLEENGDVINSSMTSDDITDSYYDTATRLETKRKSLDQYYELLKKASNIEEIVYVQKIIDGIIEDIEAMEGKLKVWNSQSDMATVSLYIRQNNDPVQIRKEIKWDTLSMDDMSYLIKQSFYGITNTVVSLLQWIVVLLLGLSPLWITMGVVIYFIAKKNKKAKANKVIVIEEKKETKSKKKE